jgi:hypothetical protein
MKPLELVEIALRNSSASGDSVLDPFAGSGSTIVACERTRQRAAFPAAAPRASRFASAATALRARAFLHLHAHFPGPGLVCTRSAADPNDLCDGRRGQCLAPGLPGGAAARDAARPDSRHPGRGCRAVAARGQRGRRAHQVDREVEALPWVGLEDGQPQGRRGRRHAAQRSRGFDRALCRLKSRAPGPKAGSSGAGRHRAHHAVVLRPAPAAGRRGGAYTEPRFGALPYRRSRPSTHRRPWT